MSESSSLSKSSNRIEWIDIAKGISIVLVVLGHTRLATVPYIGEWLGAFRMPFFFFVSGLLFNRNKMVPLNQFLMKKWKGLGRPFLIFSVVVALGYFFMDTPDAHAILSEFPMRGWGGYALWFILVLFVTNALYFVICRIFTRDIIRLIILILLACIGWITYIYELPNFWNLNFALTAVFFYGFGNFSASLLMKWFNKPAIIIVSIGILSAMISFCFVFNDRPEFFVNKLGGSVITHVAGIAGAVMMCCFSYLFSKEGHRAVAFPKAMFKYLGKNSYVVLAFHQITILLLTFWLPQLPALLRHIIMWVVIIILIEIITRKFPYIIGRKRISA